jgi:outer membrane protein assembly factor BamB
MMRADPGIPCRRRGHARRPLFLAAAGALCAVVAAAFACAPRGLRDGLPVEGAKGGEGTESGHGAQSGQGGPSAPAPAPVSPAVWPGWRGPGGAGVAPPAGGAPLPVSWGREGSSARSLRFRVELPGAGLSSPVVHGEHVFITSASGAGHRRALHALERRTGAILWTREIEDDWPEIASAITGHAAATPATDGRRVVAFFGSAGAVACSFAGDILWRREFGDFETELGLASSPVIADGRVLLVCDHDGDRASSFDSFLIALDVEDGKILWKTERPGLFRSWSTPLVLPPAPRGRRGAAAGLAREVREIREVIVNAQDELRAYDLATGELLWWVRGMTGWVTPSPVHGAGLGGEDGLLLAASGKSGPVLAVRPGGRGDVSKSHVLWRHEGAGPYVSSPLYYEGRLYVADEQGILDVYDTLSGERLHRRRLEGKFTASPVAGDGRVYLVAEAGDTFVVEAGGGFEVLARNSLGERSLASPAIAGGEIYLRTEKALYAIGSSPEEGAVSYLAREVPRWRRENGCSSCHHQGDGARALYAARRASLPVPAAATAETSEWLARPERWGDNKGDPAFSDERLAGVQFAAALLAAKEAGEPAAGAAAALGDAARLIARLQADDGSFRFAATAEPGAPVAWGTRLATLLARDVLRAAGDGDEDAGRDPDGELARRAEKAGEWLEGAEVRNVFEAAVALLALGAKDDATSRERRGRALELIARGQAEDGGWGPYAASAPEPFDTALVLLALRAGPAGDAAVEERIRRGREHLAATQLADGSWPPTTRPPGAESYAHRVSTTAWVAMALLATR